MELEQRNGGGDGGWTRWPGLTPEFAAPMLVFGAAHLASCRVTTLLRRHRLVDAKEGPFRGRLELLRTSSVVDREPPAGVKRLRRTALQLDEEHGVGELRKADREPLARHHQFDDAARRRSAVEGETDAIPCRESVHGSGRHARDG